MRVFGCWTVFYTFAKISSAYNFSDDLNGVPEA